MIPALSVPIAGPHAMIDLRDVSKSFPQGGQALWVLRHVDLTIREGEFVSVVGPSGSGKSTLLHVLGLLDAPTSGTYLLEGVDVATLSERARTALHRDTIGFVFQAYHLLDDLTVYENIEAPLLYAKLSAGERKARVAEALDRFGIVAKRDLFPAQLSGGQQQLVGVARALVTRPRLLLADEPTGNLHSSQGALVMEAFREANERDGVTVVQVTHSDRAAAYGHRVVELADGRVTSDHRVAAVS